ncbi:MAG: Localization factor PodJS [Caulobacter sp.]|nr:Localization factor PodJS [Caulobacter sp.]
MMAGAPWSVKGIDPKAREVAKDLARRSGLTLGQWLNQMIIEGEGGDERAPAVDETPPEPVAEAPGKSQAAPSRTAAPSADEIGRVTQALDRLTQRIEAAESRSTQAISGIDESVRGALSRIEGAEREHVAVAARFEGAVDGLKSEQMRAAERLRRVEIEATGPRSAEALRALEGALGKVASHLYDGEARTRDALAALETQVSGQLPGLGGPAIDPAALVDQVVARLGERLEAAETRTAAALRDLGTSFSALDGRVRAVEGGDGVDLDSRLESLTSGLTERMEAVRQEMAAKLHEAADGRFDRMERRLVEMTAHVQAAEQRSAQAIERMGHEVISIADVLNRRVQTAETRNAAAIDQIGGEVARVAASVDQRFSRADAIQAQALEKLGGEIARITEKLADRIGAAERRNALAIDDVGDQVGRVTERLNQRQERTSSELIERIRLSEERTARLLEEAREAIDTRLGEVQRRRTEQAAAPEAPFEPEADVAPPSAEGDRFSYVSEPEPEVSEPDAPIAEPAARTIAARDAQSAIFDTPAFEAPSLETGAFPPAESGRPPFADEDFEAADGFAPIAEAPSSQTFDGDYVLDTPSEAAPVSADEPARPLSTREVIEQARAAARLAAQNVDAKGKKAGSSLFAGFGGKAAPSRRRTGSTLATVFMVSGTAAAMGMAAAGMMLLARQPGGETSQRVAEAGRAGSSLPRAAIALAPQLVTPVAPAPAAPVAASAGQEAQALYDDGVRRIEAKDKTGLQPLRRAANLGSAKAQFYLAKLYEVGEGGVKKDAVEARRWTERAAQGGEPRAMHNLALYAFKGEGGAKDAATSASWFRRAADLGLVDSQFNLAQLYEGGWGVRQNAAEAYKWYLIAARAGDGTSRTQAATLRRQLTAEAQRTAERSAAGFRAQAAGTGAPLTLAAASSDVLTAQRALARLGYYQSPQDGVASPGLPLALAAYQRDQGLATTGALDAETLARLSAFAR